MFYNSSRVLSKTEIVVGGDWGSWFPYYFRRTLPWFSSPRRSVVIKKNIYIYIWLWFHASMHTYTECLLILHTNKSSTNKKCAYHKVNLFHRVDRIYRFLRATANSSTISTLNTPFKWDFSIGLFFSIFHPLATIHSLRANYTEVVWKVSSKNNNITGLQASIVQYTFD